MSPTPAPPRTEPSGPPKPDTGTPPAPPLARVVSEHDRLPPLVRSSLVPKLGAAAAPPEWLSQAALIPTPRSGGNLFHAPLQPLFEPRWQRSILTRLASTKQPLGPPDVEVIVAHIARGVPLRRVPRRLVPSAARGLQLLIDQSASMEPFRLDTAQLARAFVRTIGAARVSLRTFHGLPAWDCQGVTEAIAYRPPLPGTPILVLSDLGLEPRCPQERAPSSGEWLEFLQRLARARCTCTVILPRDLEELPHELRRAPAQWVAWSRATRVSRLTRAMDLPAAPQLASPLPDGVIPLSAALAVSAHARELGSLGSIASRIEPQLLRALRLELLPNAPVRAEAELWFSPLVSERAATGIVLDHRHRSPLQQRLASDSRRLDAAREIIASLHHDAPPALRMEEELAYRWLRGDTDEARQLLRSAVATLVEPERVHVWKWAAQALERLPRSLTALEELQMFALGTALRSGEPSTLELAGARAPGDWSWLAPPSRGTQLGINLRRGAIEFLPATARPAHRISVPDSNPVLIEMVGPSSVEQLRINPSARTVVNLPAERVELRVPGGGAWQLEAAQQAEQRYIARQRPPRVELQYEVELYGAKKFVQLPLVIGVLADLSNADERSPLPERKLLEIDIDNFDDRMAQLRPRLSFSVPNAFVDVPGSRLDILSIQLELPRLDAFSPAGIVEQVPILRALREYRRSDAGEPERAELLQQLAAVQHRDWSRSHLDADALDDLESRMSAQLDHILHHEAFQRLEGTWLGLHYLVSQAQTGSMLKIRVLDISRQELIEMSSQSREKPGLERILNSEYEHLGGEPYTCLVSDCYLGNSGSDPPLLDYLARLCQAANCPFIAGAKAGVVDLNSWQELEPTRLARDVSARPEYRPWRWLRANPASRFLTLAAPRFLARPPHETEIGEGIYYREDTGAESDASRFAWANAAFAMGACICRAFTRHGWCARIEGIESGGGSVDDLPQASFQSPGNHTSELRSIEANISTQMAEVLAKMGLTALIHLPSWQAPAFLRAQTIYEPGPLTEVRGTATEPAVRLPSLLAGCRIAHYLACMLRDPIGAPLPAKSAQASLQGWLDQYVDPQPNTSEGVHAEKPLASAKVSVEALESGGWAIQLEVLPHYQLHGLHPQRLSFQLSAPSSS